MHQHLRFPVRKACHTGLSLNKQLLTQNNMKYYANKNAQSNGDHEVHNAECSKLPYESNRKFLGEFYTCKDAVNKAKETDSSADGCKICSPACHTR